MQQMKKSIAILFTDRALLQQINTQLFKANLAKTARIRRKKIKKQTLHMAMHLKRLM